MSLRGEKLTFQHLFCKPIDSCLLTLDGLVLSLDDGEQVSLAVICFLGDSHDEVVGIDPTYSVNDSHHNIVAWGVSSRYDILHGRPWDT